MTENNFYSKEEERKIIECLLKIGHLSGSIEDWIKEDTVNARTHAFKHKLSPFSSRPEDDHDSDGLAQRSAHARN